MQKIVDVASSRAKTGDQLIPQIREQAEQQSRFFQSLIHQLSARQSYDESHSCLHIDNNNLEVMLLLIRHLTQFGSARTNSNNGMMDKIKACISSNFPNIEPIDGVDEVLDQLIGLVSNVVASSADLRATQLQYEVQLSVLESELHTLKSDLKTQNLENGRLQNELQAYLKDKAEVVDSLTQEIIRLTESLNQSENENKQLKQNFDGQVEDISLRDQRAAELEDELNQVKKDSEAKNTRLAELTEFVTHRDVRISQLSNRLNSLKTDIEGRDVRISDLITQLANKDHHLSKVIEESTESSNQQEIMVIQIKSQLNVEIEARQEAERQVAVITTEFNRLESEIGDQHRKQEATISDLRAANSSLVSEAQILKDELTWVKGSYEEYQQDTSTKMKEMAEKLMTRETEICSLSQRYNQENEANARLISDLQKTLVEVETARTNFENQNNQLNQEIELLKNDLQRHEQQNVELAFHSEELNACLIDAEAKYVQLESVMERKCEEHRDRMTSKNEELKRVNAEWQTKLRDSEFALCSELSKTKSELDHQVTLCSHQQDRLCGLFGCFRSLVIALAQIRGDFRQHLHERGRYLGFIEAVVRVVGKFSDRMDLESNGEVLQPKYALQLIFSTMGSLKEVIQVKTAEMEQLDNRIVELQAELTHLRNTKIRSSPLADFKNRTASSVVPRPRSVAPKTGIEVIVSFSGFRENAKEYNLDLKKKLMDKLTELGARYLKFKQHVNSFIRVELSETESWILM